MKYIFANTLICLATFFTICNGVKEELDTRPENTAVLEGQSFQLSCGKKTNISSTYISWWSSKRCNIAINDEVVSGYKVAWDGHRTSSVLTGVGDRDSSGTYICHVTHRDVEFTAAAAEVIVVEQPKCSQTVTDIAVEGEVVEFTCAVKYDGHWAPILKWSDISSHTALVINETDKYYAKYKLATIIHRDMHMRQLMCNAIFDENYAKYQLPNGHARNTPSSNKLEGCRTKPLDVHWPPSEDRIIIYPEKSTYESGERIHCTAEINPFANRIRWLDSNDEIVSQETLVTGQPGEHFYICDVSNVVGRPGNEQHRTARRYFNFTVGPGTETQKPVILRQQSNESAQNGIQRRQLLLTFLLNLLVFHIW